MVTMQNFAVKWPFLINSFNYWKLATKTLFRPDATLCGDVRSKLSAMWKCPLFVLCLCVQVLGLLWKSRLLAEYLTFYRTFEWRFWKQYRMCYTSSHLTDLGMDCMMKYSYNVYLIQLTQGDSTHTVQTHVVYIRYIYTGADAAR